MKKKAVLRDIQAAALCNTSKSAVRLWYEDVHGGEDGLRHFTRMKTPPCSQAALIVEVK